MIGDKEQQRSTLVKWRQAGRAGDFLFDDHDHQVVQNDDFLKIQTVVVTGATSGIGRETAIELSRFVQS